MPVVPGASGTFRSPGIAVGSYINPSFKTQYAQFAPAAPIRTARFATPMAFGLGQARGMEAISQGLANMANSLQRIQLQDEENELKSLDVELSNRIRAELYGDPETGQEGYLTSQNNAALDGYVPVRQRIAKIRDEMIQDISSSRVKDRFTVAAGRRLNIAYTEMAQHNNRARNNVSQQVAEARINNAKNDAADNPAVLPQSLATIGQEVVAKMNRAGVTDDTVIANEVEKEQSDAVLQSINLQLSENNANGAAALLRDYADIISPAARAKASVAVMRNLVVEEAQTLADEAQAQGLRGEEARQFVKDSASNPEVRDNAMARLDTMDRRRRQERQDRLAVAAEALPGQSQAEFDRIRGLGGDDYAQMIEMAREIEDPRTRAATVDLLRREEADDARRNSAANVAEEVDLLVKDAIAQAGSDDPDAVQGVLDEWEVTQPDRFSTAVENKAMNVVLERERQRKVLQQAQIQEARVAGSQAIAQGQPLDAFLSANPGYAEELAKSPEAQATLRQMDHARATGEVFARASDGQTLHNYRQMTAQEQVETNLLEMRHKMNASEFSEASRMQAAARNHLARAQDENLRWINTEVDKAMRALSPSGRDYGTTKASDSDRAINNAIFSRALVEIENFVDSEGRNPRPSEIQEIVAREVAGVSIERQGFFSPVTQFLFGDVQIDPTQFEGITAEQVDTATVEYSTILPQVRSRIANFARDGTAYPDGKVPADVMSSVAASMNIAAADHLDKAIRRRAWQRAKRLLGVQ